jgi:dihydrofolate synthase/folylpolyglutamate synthase
MSVGLAFDYFSKEKVDIALKSEWAEDWTQPTLSTTDLSNYKIWIRSHTVLEIPWKLLPMKKAGIIKHEIPVVIGEYTTETTKRSLYKKKLEEYNSNIYFASDLISETYTST